MKDPKVVINNLKDIFINKNLNDDEVANEMLDLLDRNRETVQFYSPLNGAFRILNIWSRTEKETGIILDLVNDLLMLDE